MKKTNYYKICQSKLEYLNYADSTRKTYLFYISQFLYKVDVSPSKLNSNDFQDFLNNYTFTSISQQNQVINAIRFLYRYGLGKKYNKVSFERPRKERKLPQIISTDHILNSLSKIENLKHKAILSIAFSVGLRVSEVINLKLVDIDSKRMVINIKQAKGNKDRIVPLTTAILNLLRQYFKEFKPKVYLFNGQFTNQYSASSCNKLVKKYIGSSYHFHLLRHSCFTNLTEQNVDIRVVQKLAGHASSKTTEIYTRVSNNRLASLPLAI